MIIEILNNVKNTKINTEVCNSLVLNLNHSKLCLRNRDLRGALSAIYRAKSDIKLIRNEELSPRTRQLIEDILTFHRSVITQVLFNNHYPINKLNI